MLISTFEWDYSSSFKCKAIATEKHNVANHSLV